MVSLSYAYPNGVMSVPNIKLITENLADELIPDCRGRREFIS